MGTFLTILAATATFIGLIFHFCVAFETKDFFFFVRKRNFKKKLENSPYKNMEDFISVILLSEKWEYEEDKNRMVFYPFPHDKKTKFVFYHQEERWYDGYFVLALYEKNIKVFEIDTDDSSYHYYFNDIDNSSDDMYADYHQDILERLQTIFSQLQSEKVKESKFQKQKKRNESIRQAKKQQYKLKQLLSSNTLWREKHCDEFNLQIFQGENYVFVTVFSEDIPIFQATWKQETFTYQFLNDHTEQFCIFHDFQSEIVSYFQEKMEKEIKNSKEQDINIYEAKREIERQIEELLSSQQWLSHEQVHKLQHTFPHDLQSLFDTYKELKVPKKMEKEILSSLQTIRSSLEQMEHETEEEKQKQIIQRKEIIQLRG